MFAESGTVGPGRRQLESYGLRQSGGGLKGKGEILPAIAIAYHHIAICHMPCAVNVKEKKHLHLPDYAICQLAWQAPYAVYALSCWAHALAGVGRWIVSMQ